MLISILDDEIRRWNHNSFDYFCLKKEIDGFNDISEMSHCWRLTVLSDADLELLGETDSWYGILQTSDCWRSTVSIVAE